MRIVLVIAIRLLILPVLAVSVSAAAQTTVLPPSNPFPPDGATDVSVDTEFSWNSNSLDGEANDDLYWFYLWSVDGVENYEFSDYPPLPQKFPRFLRPGTEYNWKVRRAENGESRVWSFRTRSDQTIFHPTEEQPVSPSIHAKGLEGPFSYNTVGRLPNYLRSASADTDADGFADFLVGDPYSTSRTDHCLTCNPATCMYMPRDSYGGTLSLIRGHSSIANRTVSIESIETLDLGMT